jgi:tetratricopeptide (TPR) repeat protein
MRTELNMRSRANVNLIRALLVFGLCGVAAVVLSVRAALQNATVEVVPTTTQGLTRGTDAERWFANVKSSCNPVEVATRISWTPAPETDEGTKYEAACWALAGRVGEARRLILELPQESRWEAAGVVFGAGHPAADAGDELAAGPLMELVVEFWPNHYQALYHAGAARFQRGDYAEAEPYLQEFLRYYEQEDGWRRNAETMLSGMPVQEAELGSG